MASVNWSSTRQILRKCRWLLPLAVVVALLSGCRTFHYYRQAAAGEWQILAHQLPVEKLIADPQTPARLRDRLQLVQKLRAFAASELSLPVDGHYRKFVDVHRPFVVWNVQAAARFSLAPKSWWYPIVGRLDYRGYFAERDARACGAALAAQGWDVYVDGVEAYSTLGWFKDPLLNTFLDHDDAELAETLFHELAHQCLFASGDTDFNEAFATTVGETGARRWLHSTGETNACEKYEAAVRRNRQFVALVLRARERLERVYGDTRDKAGNIVASPKPLPPAQVAAEKQRAFEQLRDDYRRLKAEWGGAASYDDWFARDLNNAKLNTVANYYDLVPGFERLLALCGGDWERFYVASHQLAGWPREKRHQRLRELAGAQVARDNAELPHR